MLCDELLRWACAPVHHPRHLRGAARNPQGRSPRSSWSSRTYGRALKVADRVVCMMEGKVTLRGNAGGINSRGHSQRPISELAHDLVDTDRAGQSLLGRPLRPVRVLPVRCTSSSCGWSTWPNGDLIMLAAYLHAWSYVTMPGLHPFVRTLLSPMPCDVFPAMAYGMQKFVAQPGSSGRISCRRCLVTFGLSVLIPERAARKGVSAEQAPPGSPAGFA